MKNLLSLSFYISLFLMILMIISDWTAMMVPQILTFLFILSALFCFSIALSEQGLVVYFVKRLFSALFVLFVIATLTFILLRLLPGGPFDEEKALPPLVKENIEKKYGLDQPLYKQYGLHMVGLMKGHLGYSYKYEGREVSDILKDAFPVSFKLGFYALLISYLIGIPLGLIAAARVGSVWDSTAMIIAISGISLPSFLVAPLLIYIFSFGWPLNILYPSFYQNMIDYDILLPAALWHTPRHYILPVVTLGIRPAAFIARLTRASVLDVIQSDFVRTARSKGLSENIILYRHVLRNSLVPVLTYSGPLIAGILSGSFVVEIIFAVPGIAKYFVQSVFNRDYPLIMALTLLFSVMLVISNLVVDVMYKIVDPRIDVT